MSKDIETISLKGKDYAKVSSRIKALHEQYDDARIATDYEFQECCAICKATITPEVNDNPDRCFTGHSMGKTNGEKAFEKLESVAVGRALANAGFLASGEIATAEEMQKFQDSSKTSDNSDDNSLSEDVENRAKKAIDKAKDMNSLRDVWTQMPDKVKRNKEMQNHKDERKKELTASEDDQD